MIESILTAIVIVCVIKIIVDHLEERSWEKFFDEMRGHNER